MENKSINVLTPIKDMPFSNRIKNALMRKQIIVLHQLLNMTYEDLLSIRNLGLGSCDEIVEILKNLGYSLTPKKVKYADNEEARDTIKDKLEEYQKLKYLLDEYKTLTKAKDEIDIMIQNVIEEFEEIRQRTRK